MGEDRQALELPGGASLLEGHPADPAVLYAGVHRRTGVEVLVSHDGGVRWARR